MTTQRMRCESGFSLVEVLVALVILSFALLGSAGLTATSLKNTGTSYYRSQATVLADDILDRMRANLAAARGQQYDISDGPIYTAAPGSMARYDCTEWYTTLAQTLPDGKGTVSVFNGVVTIVVKWDGGESSFTTVSQL
jgi:type IV pilus assembly protein PilV